MKVRSSKIYDVTQYNEWGDHPLEYRWSDSIPIISEDPLKLAPIEDCDPEHIHYSIFSNEAHDDYFNIKLGWMIFENMDGEVVGVSDPVSFIKDFDIIQYDQYR